MNNEKTLGVTSVILSFAIASHAQESKKIEARMVRPPFAGGDASHALQEVALDLKAHAAGIGDRVAVRVCSKERLPVALVTATASPFELRELLAHYGFQSRLILFLRSEDCLSRDPSIAVTEFWVVPSGANPPLSIESVRADETQVSFVRTADTIKTAVGYRAALRKMTETASNRTEVVAVVIGSYYKRPSVALKKNLERAKEVLERNDVQASRVFVRAVRYSGVREGNEREPQYPSLFILTTDVDSAQMGDTF